MDISTNSQTRVKNTGKNKQFLNPGLIVGDYLVPYGFNIPISPEANNADIISLVRTKLDEGMLETDPNKRIYFIGPYESLDDQSEAPSVQTLGYGKKVTTDRGRAYHNHSFDEGGFQYFQSVLSFRDRIREFKTVRVDAHGNLYFTASIGTVEGDLSGQQIVAIKGIELSRLYPADWKAANKDTEAMYGIEIGMKTPSEWNENLFVVEMGEDMLAFAEDRGVQDVELQFIDTEGGGVILLLASVAGRRINLVDALPEMLVVASFKATNEDNGNEIDVDSVVYNPDTKIVRVTLDTADPHYMAGVKGSLQLTDLVTLGTAGFKYYESNKIKFDMPIV